MKANTQTGQVTTILTLPLCINCKHCVNSQSFTERKIFRNELISHHLSCDKAKYYDHNRNYLLTQASQKTLGTPSLNACFTTRSQENKCGKDGKWFEHGKPTTLEATFSEWFVIGVFVFTVFVILINVVALLV